MKEPSEHKALQKTSILVLGKMCSGLENPSHGQIFHFYDRGREVLENPELNSFYFPFLRVSQSQNKVLAF